MVTIEFEYKLEDYVYIRDVGVEALVTGYFVGSNGVQYLVDYFDKNDRKLSTYLYPFQLTKR